MLLYLLSWISVLLLVIVCVFSLAAGIYQITELVEEYTVASKRIITGLFWLSVVGTIGVYLFEGFPTTVFLCGVASHVCYFVILGTFPFISMTSPAFLGSIVLLFVKHYVLLSHFEEVWYPFSEILAYVVICVWMVPFALFVSLSANDYVLPTTSHMAHMPSSANGASGRAGSKQPGVKALMDAVISLFPSRKKHF